MAASYVIDIVSVDCDGLIDKLLPIWLENGVNTMFPIEVGTWHAGMAPWREQYGKDIRGVGGMNKTVFSRDFAALKEEVERLKPLVDLGGYIPCPDHRIAPGAKWENVLRRIMDNSKSYAVKLHSLFYYDFVEAIPLNYPEIISLLKDQTQLDLSGSYIDHFQNDLLLYPTFDQVKIIKNDGSLLWSYKENNFSEMSFRNELIEKALAGSFNYHIRKVKNETIIHTYYPVVSSGEIIGIVEIYDIDDKTGSTMNQNNISIMRIIMIGGLIFYILLFALFYRAYHRQDKTLKELDKSHKLTLHSMSLLAELRDNETGAHIIRTKEYCRILAVELSKNRKYRKYLTSHYIEDLERSAPLHDIGKVGIPDGILLKSGKLTDSEFQIIKTHTTLGAEVLLNAALSLDFQSFFDITTMPLNMKNLSKLLMMNRG